MSEHRNKHYAADIVQPEPRWPVVLGLLAVGGLYVALPEALAIGPRWLLMTIVLVLLVPAIITHHRGHPTVNNVLGYLLSGVITAFMLGSIARLIMALPDRAVTPTALLISASLLWLTNILVFATWYWRLDAGGPRERARREGHPTGAFLFPQMTADERHRRGRSGQQWSPDFIDYLFLAFNTSTAFSPTDAPVLSRWAKVLMMVQSLISLIVIVALAARAINIM